MMFPMIPQYFYSKPAECAGFNSSVAEKVIDIVKSPKVRKKFKIIVAGVIDVDVESDNIPVDELLDGSDDELQEQIRIYSEGNTLRCNTKTWSWLKQVPLAEDCHSCNVILYQECASIIKIKTVRKILPAEELVLWFSGELLSVLQIPHLLPNNILSEKQYVCHKCRFQCEMPNPIKIHLSLDCGKSSKTSLWNRLRELQEDIIDRPSSQNSMSLYFDKKVDLSVSNSAFKPYKKVVKEESSHDKVIPDKKKLLTDTTVKESVAELSEADILYQQAVEMETIVSNLGRFKQGHLCVFCGKVYSRKYGLKIHTRTHTGFRPLKCKYCLRPFGDPSNLNKHVRLHSEGNTPYKCELCGKILVRKRDLERHMKSRH